MTTFAKLADELRAMAQAVEEFPSGFAMPTGGSYSLPMAIDALRGVIGNYFVVKLEITCPVERKPSIQWELYDGSLPSGSRTIEYASLDDLVNAAIEARKPKEEQTVEQVGELLAVA
jgi:hypothetical protein